MKDRLRLGALVAIGLLTNVGVAADYTRDGGTADWQCCADKACGTVISQHADAVRAVQACGKLTDADGKTRYTRSQAFRITPSTPVATPVTGSATIRWTPPTTNADGSALTDLAGYRVLYGTSPSALTKAIVVSIPGASSQVVPDLAAGTWYFAVVAFNSSGTDSAASSVATKTIQ